MKEIEGVPDRAQRERELYELRAKGLATNQVQKFEDLSTRRRRQVDEIIFGNYDKNTDPNVKPTRENRGDMEVQQWSDAMVYYQEGIETAPSMSTESTDSNGPFVYTLNQRDDAASIASTVSSITFYESMFINADKKELESTNRGPAEIPLGIDNDFSDGLLGVVEEQEEDEEIIFEACRDPLSPQNNLHLNDHKNAFVPAVSTPTIIKTSPLMSLNCFDNTKGCAPSVPVLATGDSSSLQKSPYPAEEETDCGPSICISCKSTESICISCKSTESLSSGERNSNIPDDNKLNAGSQADDSCIQQPKPFVSIWNRYRKPSRRYKNMRGSDEHDREKQSWAQECSQAFDEPTHKTFHAKCWLCLAIAFIFAATTGVGGAILLFIVAHKAHDEYIPTAKPTFDVNQDVQTEDTSRLESLRDLVGSLSGFRTLDDPLKPQYMALDWLASKDVARLDLAYDMYDTIAERYVISLIYFSTKGETWANQHNFLSPKPVCEWNDPPIYHDEAHPSRSGIICDHDGNVAQIVLAENNLKGSLPWELTSLESLQLLFLSGNHLTGNIPTHLGLLTNLHSIDLVSNQLEGSIPTEIGWLKSLEHLDIRSNLVSGTVPTEIGKLTEIQSIILADNKLEGSLPSEIGSLSTLKTFNVFANNLEGSMPKEIGNLELEVLNLRGNDFLGDLDPDFCGREYLSFWADCRGTDALVRCSCCTSCCDEHICCNETECCVLDEDSNCISSDLVKDSP